MNRLMIVVAMAALLAGCAFTKQALQDYKVGKDVPLAEGEISPKDQAKGITEPLGGLPIVGPFAGFLGVFLTGFLTYRRGANIRRNDGNVTPVMVTNHNMITGLIQDAANLASGLFSTKSGSDQTPASTVIQRVWKVALATVASGATLAAANPSLQTYLFAHPGLSALFVGVTSGIAGIEKALSNVPPVVKLNPNTTSSTVVTL